MDGAQQPGRWGRRTTVACGGTMADSGGSPDYDLERATVHQILHGLFLQYRSETVIPFHLPSSGGGQRGERVAVTSFARTQSTTWGSFNGSPA
jgi:hypothetical protein